MNEEIKEYTEAICEKCEQRFSIAVKTYKSRCKKSSKTPMLCPKCMQERMHEIKTNYFKKLSSEEQQKFKDKRNWYSRATDEEKKAHSQKAKDQMGKRTKEEWDIINAKNSAALKKYYTTQTEEQKKARIANAITALAEKRKELSDEEKSIIARKWFDKLSPEEQEEVRKHSAERMRAYNESLSEEEKHRRTDAMNQWHRNLSEEEKNIFYEKTHEWYFQLNEEAKQKYAQTKRDWYNQLSLEKQEEHRVKSIEYWNSLSIEDKAKLSSNALKAVSNSRTSACKKFENMFNSSHLISDYHLEIEYTTIYDTAHSWDYGILKNKTNELVMVVDVDGVYFHADKCDYDGIHSKEEYDERRTLSIDPDNKIIPFIIQEYNISKCFELMVKLLIKNYDEYINTMFTYFRSMPFPEPHYNDNELLKSWRDLLNLKVSDKYHRDISLNTRIGDRIITHFHPSIYHAHRQGNISPYNAWYNDDLLRKCIENRIIYQNHLNPNKILQGFNISKIAQKVSVFSAGRAKMIINKYLKEYDTIFDPFSGFSGRMLGAVSLDKSYIGQDISEIHVRESNNIISYFNFNRVNIQYQDILQSTGTYPCLFTCPPYGLKEQWCDVKPDSRTCDDWIDICLYHFKCQRYVFVVDDTKKYKSNVVDIIINKSHFGKNSEYIIMI